MTSPLEGNQNERGQYVGPENPLVKVVALAVATLFFLLILLGLSMVVAWFLCQVFFSGHHFHTMYVLTIIGVLALLCLLLRLENGYYHE